VLACAMPRRSGAARSKWLRKCLREPRFGLGRCDGHERLAIGSWSGSELADPLTATYPRVQAISNRTDGTGTPWRARVGEGVAVVMPLAHHRPRRRR